MTRVGPQLGLAKRRLAEFIGTNYGLHFRTMDGISEHLVWVIQCVDFSQRGRVKANFGFDFSDEFPINGGVGYRKAALQSGS